MAFGPGLGAIEPLLPKNQPGARRVDDMVRRGYLRMWPRPPVPGIADLIAIAGEEIHDMLAGTKATREALTIAQNRAESLLKLRCTR